MVLDAHTRDFYDAVNDRWNGSRAAGRFPHLAFVSVGGGERDIQVRGGSTPQFNSLNSVKWSKNAPKGSKLIYLF